MPFKKLRISNIRLNQNDCKDCYLFMRITFEKNNMIFLKNEFETLGNLTNPSYLTNEVKKHWHS